MTRSARQSHTRTWAVVRLVDLPANYDNESVVTVYHQSGTQPRDDLDQAEKSEAPEGDGRAEQYHLRGDQAEQHHLSQEGQLEPELSCYKASNMAGDKPSRWTNMYPRTEPLRGGSRTAQGKASDGPTRRQGQCRWRAGH